MLRVSNLSKRYGDDLILSEMSFVVSRGERIGLVGPNGSGKTTLLRIIAGLEPADQGSVSLNPPDSTVGYLAQALIFADEETVDDWLAGATAQHSRAWSDMQRCAEAMAEPAESTVLETLTQAYAEAEARFESAGGYALEAHLAAVLDGLDLAEVPRDLPVARLSGGQKTRLGLAKLLIRRPQLLLLDEPTNHLDIDALAWLENWLGSYEGAVLIVSHDRTFLDAVTTRTLALDPTTHMLRDVAGNYSTYLDTLAREVEQQWQAYQDQQDEIARLQESARHLRGQAKFRRGGKADTPDKFAKAFFANRSAATVGRAKDIERRIERLLTEDRVDKPGQQWGLKLDFSPDDRGARQVLTLENVSMAFGDRVLFEDVSLTLTHGERIVLVGPNGAGKTTLLRLITGQMEPKAGQIRVGAGVKLGYLAQEQEVLAAESTPYGTIQTVADEMSQTEIRSFLHAFLFSGDEVFVKNGNLSFGERARLMLARLIAQGCNFLVLDEPINHLDIPGRERFEQALTNFSGTVLAVVHDRTFIRRIATGVWELREGKVRERFNIERDGD
ncbi:MAG: ABC-F family ATP-binding cassette domain-containing protein [Anaerolineae bacterium]|nr:ABC-F family ATP-binding cassette domain-containing protein [Anaerolineae bacterium]